MIIQVKAGRFKAEIGNFVTKRRFGFARRAGGRGVKKGCSEPQDAAECWPPTSCQSRSSVCPFRGSPKGPPRRLRSLRRGRIRTRGGIRRRRVAQATPRSGGARQVRRRTRTTVRSAGTAGFSTGPPKRRRKPTLFGPVAFSRSLYRSPGSPSFSPVDESLGLFDNWVRRRAALSRSCARDGAEILERLGA